MGICYYLALISFLKDSITFFVTLYCQLLPLIVKIGSYYLTSGILMDIYLNSIIVGSFLFFGPAHISLTNMNLFSAG
jgi:hypothetical protein